MAIESYILSLQQVHHYSSSTIDRWYRLRLIWDQKYLAREKRNLSERPRAATKMAAGPVSERNQDATIYVGGLDEKVFLYQKKRS